MLVPTFRPTTAWAGRSVDCGEGQFLAEGHGQVTADAVLTHVGTSRVALDGEAVHWLRWWRNRVRAQ